MVQLTTSVAVAVLLAVPSLAAPFRVGPHAEDHAGSHVEAREPRVRAALGKARKVITSGRVGAAAEVAGAGATIAATQQSARDVEDLEVRFPASRVGGGARPAIKIRRKPIGGGTAEDRIARPTLAAREPIFGKVFKVAKKVVGGAAQVAAGALSSREFEEMQELALRELDSFEEVATREPGSLSGAIKDAEKRDAARRAKGLGGAYQLTRREPRASKVSAKLGGKGTVGTLPSVLHQQLATREPGSLSGAIERFKKSDADRRAKGLGGAVHPVRREVRGGASPAVGIRWPASGRHAGGGARPHVMRRGVERREPRVRAALGKARKVITSGRVGAAAEVAAAGATVAATQQTARDVEDLETRFPARRVGGGARPAVGIRRQPAGGRAGGSASLAVPSIAAREPIFGKIFKVAKKVAGGAAQVAAGALSGRDLETVEELAAREYFDSEIDELD